MKRKLMTMAFGDDEIFEQILLTDLQREVVSLVMSHFPCGMTSSELATATGKTMRRCSVILKILHVKGYMTRVPDTGSENGLIYRYVVDPLLWGK